MKGLRATFAAMMIVLGASAYADITLTFFPSSTFSTDTAAMNEALGISNYTIDDFSSIALISGLTITLSGVVPTTTLTALPALFNQNSSGCGTLNGQSFSWTNAYAITNTTTNSIQNCGVAQGFAQFTTFNYSPGATSLGIGLANFQSLDITKHELFVNGEDLGVLETLAGANWSPGTVLNAYLRIDATNGAQINSVTFENLTGQDFVGFSDFAVQPLAPPTVTPSLVGTPGLSGWYTSTVALSWTVTGNPAPTTSGCASASVPNTKDKKYTCSATNAVGSAKDSVTIKVDTVKPAIALSVPTNNASYGLNQSVTASYTCSDATSGVASCVGTSVNGALITSTPGKQTFSVTAIDNAGNTTTKSVTYHVGGAAKTPVLSLAAGTYVGAQTLSISDATTGAVIYYTTNGTTPTASSPVYGGSITVGVTETLKAVAIAPGYTRSGVATAAYTIQ